MKRKASGSFGTKQLERKRPGQDVQSMLVKRNRKSSKYYGRRLSPREVGGKLKRESQNTPSVCLGGGEGLRERLGHGFPAASNM